MFHFYLVLFGFAFSSVLSCVLFCLISSLVLFCTCCIMLFSSNFILHFIFALCFFSSIMERNFLGFMDAVPPIWTSQLIGIGIILVLFVLYALVFSFLFLIYRLSVR